MQILGTDFDQMFEIRKELVYLEITTVMGKKGPFQRLSNIVKFPILIIMHLPSRSSPRVSPQHLVRKLRQLTIALLLVRFALFTLMQRVNYLLRNT